MDIEKKLRAVWQLSPVREMARIPAFAFVTTLLWDGLIRAGALLGVLLAAGWVYVAVRLEMERKRAMRWVPRRAARLEPAEVAAVAGELRFDTPLDAFLAAVAALGATASDRPTATRLVIASAWCGARDLDDYEGVRVELAAGRPFDEPVSVAVVRLPGVDTGVTRLLIQLCDGMTRWAVTLTRQETAMAVARVEPRHDWSAARCDGPGDSLALADGAAPPELLKRYGSEGLPAALTAVYRAARTTPGRTALVDDPPFDRAVLIDNLLFVSRYHPREALKVVIDGTLVTSVNVMRDR